MGKKGGSKKGGKQGKKPHKNQPTSKKYSHYAVSGEKAEKKLPFCPRCGPGVFLSVSQGRKYCGKCHYSEFDSKEAKK